MCLSKHDTTVETAFLAQLIEVCSRVFLAVVLCVASVIPGPLSLKSSLFHLGKRFAVVVLRV